VKPPPSKPGPKMMGRPPVSPDGARGKMFCLRLLPAERSAVEAAAERAKLSASEWGRRALVAAAAKSADDAAPAPELVASEPAVASEPEPAEPAAGDHDAHAQPGEDPTVP
jgi:hypothetical protein